MKYCNSALCRKVLDKMSTSSCEFYAARVNSPVHISLTAAAAELSSSSARMSTSDQPFTGFSRVQSFPTIHPTVRHGSLTLIVHSPPASETQSGVGGQSKSMQVGRERHSWSGDPSLSKDDLRRSACLNPGGLPINPVPRRRRDAPAPPRLPGYTELIAPPPAYNPDFLSPASCQLLSDAVGVRSVSTSAYYPYEQSPPSPLPPSRARSFTGQVRGSLPSLPLIHQQQSQRLMHDSNDDNENDDQEDDVFLTEKTTTTPVSSLSPKMQR